MNDDDLKLWRTLLFVPADRPRMLAKAQSLGADVLVIDLEDAIELSSKDDARATLREHLADGALSGPSRVCVRINRLDRGGRDDLAALRDAGIEAIMLPKTESHRDVRDARAAIPEALGTSAVVALVAQVESVAGVMDIAGILEEDVQAVAFGGEDFAVDLGVPRSPDSVELTFPRAWIALHARRARVPAIDTVFTDLTDTDGLEREAALAAQLGFVGKLLIHPVQIEPVRRLLSPSDGEVTWAREVIAAAASARESGKGVVVVNGKMVDPPVVAQAASVLARAEASA